MKPGCMGNLLLAMCMVSVVTGAAWVFMPVVAPLLSGLSVTSGAPATINHQGLVTVNGSRFNGSGSFKFAILDPDTGLNRWTNDGTNVNNSGTPTGSVSLQVTDGVYSVRLGASPMPAVSASVFADDNLQLRIWFDDGTNGIRQLSPDHVLSSVPYALAIADNVVTTAKVADGAITTAKIADGAITTAKLMAGAGTPTGVIQAYGGSSAPAGWLMCDGSAVSRTTYAVLFTVLGTGYGSGDGSTTFNLPDLRGRVPVGADASAGRLTANNTLGGAAGEEKHTLTVTEMPAHNHGVTDPGHSHSYTRWWADAPTAGGGSFLSDDGSNNPTVATGASTTGITIQNSGGGQAHNVMQPYQVVNYIIKN